MLFNEAELLTNATVVDDAIRFVSQKFKERVESTDSSNEDEKESKEPDYDEDQLEEKQEEENGEITTNSTFWDGMRAGFEYYRALFDDIKQNKEYSMVKLQMPVLARW